MNVDVELIVLESEIDFEDLLSAITTALPFEYHGSHFSGDAQYCSGLLSNANLVIDDQNGPVLTNGESKFSPSVMEQCNIVLEVDINEVTERSLGDGLKLDWVSEIHSALPSHVKGLFLNVLAHQGDSAKFVNHVERYQASLPRREISTVCVPAVVFVVCVRADRARHQEFDLSKLVLLSFLDYHRPSYSVLMPVFNHYPIFFEALRSIEFASTRTNSSVEVLAVDDGSANPPASITSTLSHTYIRKQTNGGVASALNEGLRHASNKWICWLSADDLFLPSFFSSRNLFLTVFNSHNLLFSNPCSLEVDKNRISVVRYGTHYLNRSALIPRFLDSNPINGITATFQRRDFGGLRFDPTFRHAQDVKFWCELSLQGNTSILNIPIVSTVSRLSSTSFSYTNAYLCKLEALISVVVNLIEHKGTITNLEPLIIGRQIYELIETLNSRNTFERLLVSVGIYLLFAKISPRVAAEIMLTAKEGRLCRPFVSSMLTKIVGKVDWPTQRGALFSALDLELSKSSPSGSDEKFRANVSALLRRTVCDP